MKDARRFAPATTRNREPILEVLKRFVPPRSQVLEIASGSGEHAVFLAPALAVSVWQPSDPDPAARESIDAWRAEAAVETVRPAIELEVTHVPWPLAQDLAPDVIVCVNMIHISPWASCEALMRGAGRHLRPGGWLYLYGPFKRRGRHTAPSNEAFDDWLKGENPAWGVRDAATVHIEAAKNGLELVEVVAMPANNLSVVFQRSEERG